MNEEARLVLRAREAVAQLFMRRLHVPEIFFEAPWPSVKTRVDVLAIDRAGSGDLHIAEIKREAEDAFNAIPQLMKHPAHYRWIVYEGGTMGSRRLVRLIKERTFPTEGAGRIGVIMIVRLANDALTAQRVVEAERFHGLSYEKIDRFKKSHEPDMCVR